MARLREFAERMKGKPFVGINVSGRDAYKEGALPIIADARDTIQMDVNADRRMSADDAQDQIGALGADAA